MVSKLDQGISFSGHSCLSTFSLFRISYSLSYSKLLILEKRSLRSWSIYSVDICSNSEAFLLYLLVSLSSCFCKESKTLTN